MPSRNTAGRSTEGRSDLVSPVVASDHLYELQLCALFWLAHQRLVRDLRELGIEPGQTLLVNASLSNIGWMEGGAQAVVAVGAEGC